jgi:LPXTG-motif cell wall-anchored protein
MGTARILAVLAIIALVAAIILLVEPAFAQERLPSPSTGTTRGAPGPIAGAGLVSVVVGAGAYWLFRRFRKIS